MPIFGGVSVGGLKKGLFVLLIDINLKIRNILLGNLILLNIPGIFFCSKRKENLISL